MKESDDLEGNINPIIPPAPVEIKKNFFNLWGLFGKQDVNPIANAYQHNYQTNSEFNSITY
jgi:hypothetical protein